MSVTALAAQPGDQGLRPDAFREAVLHYHASKFFISADSRVTQRWMNEETARATLYPITSMPDAGLSPGERTAYVGIESEVIGRRSLAEVWLKPDGVALQRTSVRLNHKHRARLYRFAPDRVWSLKRYPVSDREKTQPWPSWSRTEAQWYPVGTHTPPLTRGEGLFYIAVSAPLKAVGDRWQGTLFDSDGLLALTLEVIEKDRISVDLTEESGSGKQRILQPVDVLRVRAQVSPLSGRGKAEDFSFLGLKGGVTLDIDPQRHLIVQLSGKADVLGAVTIRLEKVQWRHNLMQTP